MSVAYSLDIFGICMIIGIPSFAFILYLVVEKDMRKNRKTQNVKHDS